MLVKPFLNKMFLYIFFKIFIALTFFNIPIFNTMVKERPRFTSFYMGNNKI